MVALWPVEFCPGGSCPLALALMQTLQFLPVCHWCPSSCCPGAGVQREGVCVSSKSVTGSLRGDTWESRSSFWRPNPHWFIQPEVTGASLPGTGTLDGDPSLLRYPSQFLYTTRGCGTTCSASLHLCAALCISTSPSLLSAWWMWLL